MPLEKLCPVCRASQGTFRTFWRTAWAQWRCPACGSLLALDTPRRLLAVLTWIAVLLAWLLLMRRAAVPMALVFISLCLLGFVTITAIDRIKVIQRRGAHCPGCGYDLRAAHDAPVCPECGRTIDAETRAQAERMQHAATVPSPQRSIGRLLLLIMILLFSLTLLIAALTHYGHLRRPPITPQPRTTQPASPPAGSPSTSDSTTPDTDQP